MSKLYHKCKVLCFIILFASMYQITYCQTGQINLLAPQVADQMKFGNKEISYYTGQSGFSVPLLNIQSKGFSIPITLNYNSEGFKPTNQTGFVGMNFYLMAEGIITRKINGEPDDKWGACSNAVLNGFYAGTKNHTSSMDNSIANFSATFNNNCNQQNVGFEYQPDEFSYHCMGHSGKFYFTYGGGVKVVADEEVRISTTNVALQNYSSQYPAASSFVITTGDGYIFTFGGDIKSLDYNYPMSSPGGSPTITSSPNPVIMAWHLTKVTSPEGKEIRYVYKNFTGNISSMGINAAEHGFYLLNKYFLSDVSITISPPSWSPVQVTNSIDNPTHSAYVYNLSKLAFLDRIESDDFSLSFEYTQKNKRFYISNNGAEESSIFHQRGYQLDRLILKNSENIEVKRVEFEYGNLGGSYGTRHFLTSLTITGEGYYDFSYYRTNEIPSPYTRNIDHWGYWKGGYDETAKIIPDVIQAPTGDQVIMSALRDPDTSYCNVGLLKRVGYPTGGSTTFIYEGHQYSRRLERRNENVFFPSVYSWEAAAGGARIKTIRDSASVNSVMTRNFKYINNYINNGNTSSGLLLDWPRYIYYYGVNLPNNPYYSLKTRGSSFHSNYNTEENYINYAEVTEENSENGFKVIKYTNYDSNPDYQDYTQHDWDGTITQYVDNLPLYKNGGFKFNDRSIERGKVRFAGVYKSDKSPISGTAYTYQPFDSNMSNVISMLNNKTWAQASKIYTQPNRLIADTTITYAATPVKELRSYEYDANKQNLRSEQFTQSNGKVTTKMYTYLNDYAIGTPFIDHMRFANLSSYPIEEVILHSEGGSTYIYAGKITQYYTGGKGWPQTVYELRNTAPVPLGAFKFSSRYMGDLPNSGSEQAFSMDLRYQSMLNYTQYDSFGNIVEFAKNLGPSNTMLWGYNGQYPIAQINGAKANEVYFQNFEDATVDYDPNLQRISGTGHTGKWMGEISNGSAAEKVSHSTKYISITSGTARRFTYSGWIYSTGPSAEMLLFMYRPGETGYFSYVDALGTSEINKWVFVKKEFLVPADVTSLRLRVDNNGIGTVRFDDLALYPSEAQIRTFTYFPLVGPSSEIGSNGIPTIYQYDGYKRLQYLKDKDYKIISSRSYHLKN